MTRAAPLVHPSRELLDDLAVLRRGLYGPAAVPRPLPCAPEVAAAATEAGAVVVVDAEGVPVVRLDEVSAGEDGLVGDPTWLGESSDRPFARLHLPGPVDLSGHDVVVVRSATDVPAPLSPDAYVLALASTSLDGPTAGTDTVRAALAAVGGDPSRVGVVPVAPEDTGRQDELFASLGLDPRAAAEPPGSSRESPREAVSGPARGGVVLLLTGLSGSGKSTVARAVSTRLVEEGTSVTLLDGDVVRRHLTAGLGFSVEDRRTNVLRIGWVAAEIAHHGGLAVCSPIAPEDAVRREVAAMAEARGARFVLVHVSTPLEECERRDRKGLYARARRGEIPDFTGISAPYDVPEAPDLRIDTTGRDVAGCADEVLALLSTRDGREEPDAS